MVGAETVNAETVNAETVNADTVNAETFAADDVPLFRLLCRSVTEALPLPR